MTPEEKKEIQKNSIFNFNGRKILRIIGKNARVTDTAKTSWGAWLLRHCCPRISYWSSATLNLLLNVFPLFFSNPRGVIAVVWGPVVKVIFDWVRWISTRLVGEISCLPQGFLAAISLTSGAGKGETEMRRELEGRVNLWLALQRCIMVGRYRVYRCVFCFASQCFVVWAIRTVHCLFIYLFFVLCFSGNISIRVPRILQTRWVEAESMND